ncbi:hypothetical protein M3Y94_00249400 [Aphelenchoides besseyi]|nr:hypothetical protein M3Y94_00249400 [Aphelenchoides besseyi]
MEIAAEENSSSTSTNIEGNSQTALPPATQFAYSVNEECENGSVNANFEKLSILGASAPTAPEVQRLSPIPMPALRPHSNSVCTASLLTADPVPKRTQIHRASDGLLVSDTLREQRDRRISQARSSVTYDQDFYRKISEARHHKSIFATVWASYFFVFLSVLITFSIVFAVGYLISSMTYRGPPLQHQQVPVERSPMKQTKQNVFDMSDVTVTSARNVIHTKDVDGAQSLTFGPVYQALFFPMPSIDRSGH